MLDLAAYRRRGTQMKIGICDDDREDLQLTYKVTTATFDQLGVEYDIKVFDKVEDILAWTEDLHLLILDIEMPGLSGIDLKKTLQRNAKGTMIIFVTNHDELMLSAFGIDVFGFAIKKNIEFQLPIILRDFISETTPRIVIDGEIDSRDIRYIKAARVYTEVHMKNGEHRLTRRSIREYEEWLTDFDFVRIHKSYLINFAWVDKVAEDTVYIGEDELPIATRQKKEIQDKYREYCRRKARYC